MFNLFRYYNAKTNKSTFVKEWEDGRQVKISKRRYIKFIKGAHHV